MVMSLVKLILQTYLVPGIFQLVALVATGTKDHDARIESESDNLGRITADLQALDSLLDNL